MVFELPPLRRSAVLVRQVFIYGAIRDNLTPDVGPRGALTVHLIDRDTGQDYPLPRKIRPDATFCFYGSPPGAFPPQEDRTFHLRIEASAPGYITNGVDFDLALGADQPQATTRAYAELDLPDMPVVLFTSQLPREINLTLNRSAVRLRGRVVRAADPTQGITGANVQGGGQSAVTDAQGHFAFPNPLPVILSLNINFTRAGFQSRTLTFEPDYTRPVNDLTVALAT